MPQHVLDERENRRNRARRRALKAHARLGIDPTVRPKGMHHATSERLSRKYLEAYNERFAKRRERLSKRTILLIKQMEQERIEHDL